jgi:K+-transporting ATPase ATPase B chain
MYTYMEEAGQTIPAELRQMWNASRRLAYTPLVVTKNEKPLGIIHLKDVVKGGLNERFASSARWASRPS